MTVSYRMKVANFKATPFPLKRRCMDIMSGCSASAGTDSFYGSGERQCSSTSDSKCCPKASMHIVSMQEYSGNFLRKHDVVGQLI